MHEPACGRIHKEHEKGFIVGTSQLPAGRVHKMSLGYKGIGGPGPAAIGVAIRALPYL